MQNGSMRFTGTIDALRGGKTAGADRIFDVEVKSDMAPLAEQLSARGCTVDRSPPLGLTVTLPEGADARLIFREARAAGAQVRHLGLHTVSLEAAFLRELCADVAERADERIRMQDKSQVDRLLQTAKGASRSLIVIQNIPDPDVLAQEFVGNLEAALMQFNSIVEELGKN